MKKILHLMLKSIYFEQIAHDIKKEEYRDIKPYWTKRLVKNNLPIEFDEVWFRNGYTKDRPFMRVEWKGLKGIKLNEKDTYAIQLGKVLEFKNYIYAV